VDALWAGLSGVGLLTVLEVVLVVLALVVAPRNRRASSALASILLSTLLPIFGIILFALIGSRSCRRTGARSSSTWTTGSPKPAAIWPTSAVPMGHRRGCRRWRT
jgi:hypothetical protein